MVKTPQCGNGDDGRQPADRRRRRRPGGRETRRIITGRARRASDAERRSEQHQRDGGATG